MGKVARPDVGGRTIGGKVRANFSRSHRYKILTLTRSQLGFERFAAQAQMRYMKLFRLDPSLDVSHLKAYKDVMETQNPADSALEGHDEHLWLYTLATHPKYQRKGVGKRLLKWGIKRAEMEGIPIGLIASPEGAGLYASAGFKDVGLCVLDFDGTRIADRAMIWWPDIERKDIDTNGHTD